MCIQPEGLLY